MAVPGQVTVYGDSKCLSKLYEVCMTIRLLVVRMIAELFVTAVITSFANVLLTRTCILYVLAKKLLIVFFRIINGRREKVILTMVMAISS